MTTSPTTVPAPTYTHVTVSTDDGRVVAEGWYPGSPMTPGYAIAAEIGQRVAGSGDLAALQAELRKVPREHLDEVIAYLGNLGAKHELPEDMPAPQHTSWCDGTCTWTNDGRDTWSCEHRVDVGEVAVPSTWAASGTQTVAASITLAERFDHETGEHVWGEEGVEAYLSELDGGPLTLEGIEALRALLARLYERLAEVLAVDSEIDDLNNALVIEGRDRVEASR